MLQQAKNRKISLSEPCFMHEIGDKTSKKECMELIKENTKTKPKIIFILIDKQSSSLYQVFK